MAGKEVSKADLQIAVGLYATNNEMTVSESENGFCLMPGDILVSLEKGKPKCQDKTVWEALCKILTDMKEEVPAMPVNIPKGKQTSSLAPVVRPDMPIRDIQVAELTLDDITQYLCPKATQQEAFMFLKLCQARGMNPFLREAYLIKYSEGQAATMVVGKEHFTKTAEKNPQFDGFEAGIIIKNATGLIERREGTFLMEDEVLVGGWAKVWRKDRSKPFVSEVNLKDFCKPTQSRKSPWDTMPAVMIRKVPLVQSLREAFANDLGDCYDRAEMDQAMTVDYEVQGA